MSDIERREARAAFWESRSGMPMRPQPRETNAIAGGDPFNDLDQRAGDPGSTTKTSASVLADESAGRPKHDVFQFSDLDQRSGLTSVSRQRDDEQFDRSGQRAGIDRHAGTPSAFDPGAAADCRRDTRGGRGDGSRGPSRGDWYSGKMGE